jgi:hypothetical protein
VSYPDLEMLVETVDTLNHCRAALDLGMEHGAPEDQLREMRLGVWQAEKVVEAAADLLADSEQRRERVEALKEELERRHRERGED